MKRTTIALAGAVGLATAVTAQVADKSLEGLWVAQQRFGPEIRGTLMILQRGGAVVADIGGFSVPLRQQGESLGFELPDARAASAACAASKEARGADGRYTTYLRNPERNQGIFLGVSRIEKEGEAVRLVGTRRGQKEATVVAAGQFDSESDALRIPIFGPRDFMKLTQLFLNDGRWEGRQIVSPEWARRSSAALRVLSPTSGQTYGYLWNSVAYDYKGRKLHAYFPGGNGGQVYIGIPDLALLVAFTGGIYADRVLFRAQRQFVPEDVLPAVK